MSKHTVNPEVLDALRHRAEALIRSGAPPKARTATTGMDALALLHEMAIDPERASAVVKLLHELQVHQVELDLQHEQLEHNRDQLNRSSERFDLAPFAYFAVDREGRIIEGNRAAADCCGLEPGALGGQRIDSLVTPETRFVLLAMMKRLGSRGSQESCDVRVQGGDGVARAFRVAATSSPEDRSFMMMFAGVGGPSSGGMQPE
jgi:PAS domain S-box-containing protein